VPDLLAHYLVSYLIARTIVEPRYALIIAFVGVVADVDALLRVHRWVTHSIPVTLLASAPLLMLAYRQGRGYLRVVVLALLLYILHIVLDVFTGLTPILWPLVPAVGVELEINGVSSINGVMVAPSVEVIVKPANFTQKEIVEGPIVSETGLVLAVVTAVLLMVDYVGRRLKL